MQQAGHRDDMADGYRAQGLRGPTFGPRGATLRPTGIVVFATLDRAHGATGASSSPHPPWHDTEPAFADGWRRWALRPMAWLLGR
jgi:hypothetical protein